MPGYHYFERMEREINWKKEYLKLEEIVLNEDIMRNFSLNDWINSHFRMWSGRQNYASFNELRDQLKFSISLKTISEYPYTRWFPDYEHSKMEDFFLYSETILNVCAGIEAKTGFNTHVDRKVTEIKNIIIYDIEKAGYELKNIQGKGILILQKNPAVSVVVDHVKITVADALMEYNHYVLKGKINRKKELLKIIADDLESKRKTELRQLNKTLESDFFNLVNKCNIRHNNFDPENSGKYQPGIAKMSEMQLEKVYDLIYEEGVMCYMTLSQVDRKDKINNVLALTK